MIEEIKEQCIKDMKAKFTGESLKWVSFGKCGEYFVHLETFNRGETFLFTYQDNDFVRDKGEAWV